jgi:hypothetical protein
MDDEPDEPRPPKREQLSKTPSWIMLGFALGAGCVLLWPRREEPRPALTSAASAPRRPAGAPKPPTIERATFFESVFAEWSKYAGWDNELTEVAFWSAETKSFSEKFEVFRSGDRFYFRSISQFTRPLLTHGVPDNSPLQFTESQAARDEWLKENSAENVRKFLGAPEPGKS